MTSHIRHIYALYDNVAQAIVGGLILHYHDAPAIRNYSDIANIPGSTVGEHPGDYDLLDLGTLNEDATITAEKRTVLTGAAWVAAQKPKLTGDTNASA